MRYAWQHSNGSESVDQDQRFILPLESFYLSKSTVLPIVTLLKCQSTWSCSRWIVYSSNYWEGDNNQEYMQHASRWSHLLCNSGKVKIQLCGESVLSLLGNNQQSSLWSSQAISQYLARVIHMMLTWCATATLKQSFKLFRFPRIPIQAGMMTGTLARVLVVRA